MKNLFLALSVTIIMGGCSTLRIQVKSDDKYDFSSLSTFSVVYTKKNDSRDSIQGQIGKRLNVYIKNMGYLNAYKSNADFYVDVDYETQQKRKGEQRILLKMYDTKENRIIWEGSAIDSEFNDFTTEQKSAYIKAIIEKLFRGFASK